MENWSGKTALVTGGSSGLGLAIATELARKDAQVAIVARGAEKLEAAAAQLRTLGKGKILPIAADITQPADVARMVTSAVDQFGRLDMLVNCAGSSARGDVRSTTTDDFRRLMEFNFFALVECTRAALPHLLAARGHLVNIGSLASKSASRYMGGYAASKFAVAAYSQQLRLELGEQGLHVLLVCPGPLARSELREYEGAKGLPEAVNKPGGGVKISQLQPEKVACRILKACERRNPELILPGKARLLFAMAQLSPRLGDWLLRRFT